MRRKQTILPFFFALPFLAQSQDCIDLSAYTQSYLQEVSFNDSLYPVGTAFVVSGEIQLVKPSTGNAYQFIQGDTLCYIGKIDIDVSNTSYSPKSLTFGSVFTQGLVVDGDTIFTANNPAPHYVGNGFTLAFANGYFTLRGNFDRAHIFGSTNCLYAICVEPYDTSGSCIDFSAYTEPYLQEVSFNDSLYPVGTAFVVSGDIQLVKPSTGNAYQFINGDTLCYIGKIDIDVSNTPYSPKRLRFGSIFTQGLVVDGDTIFTGNNPAPNYVGNGFEVAFANGYFSITGDFEVAHIYGSTNCLNAICVEPYFPVTATQEPENPVSMPFSVLVYPNPFSDKIYIESPYEVLSYAIFAANGSLITTDILSSSQSPIELGHLPQGFYFLVLENEKGQRVVQKIVK